jgi:hypothetical protein
MVRSKPWPIGQVTLGQTRFGLPLFWNLLQDLWVKIGQFNGVVRVDLLRDGRTNKWCKAKIALAA